MRVFFSTLLWFAGIGLCLSGAAIRVQISNPTYAVLTLEQYRAYYRFYALGAYLDTFAALGLLSAVLLLASFVLWASRTLGLLQFLRFSRRGESFSWPWCALVFCTTSLLGSVWQLGMLVCLGGGLLLFDLGLGHVLGLLALPLVPLGLALGLKRQLPNQRVLLYPLLALSVLGAGFAFWSLDLSAQLLVKRYLVPPMLSTHYGPWGILGWSLALTTSLGGALGLALVALRPRPGAEPDSIHPLPPGRLPAVALCGLFYVLIFLASYPLYFVPRYQLGQDLRDLLNLKYGETPGRTVLFLDKAEEVHTTPSVSTWSHRKNLETLAHWMVSAPTPSALTRPASKILSDYALWQWRPEDALDWMEVHRRRLAYSNLNRAFLEALAQRKPSPEMSKHLDSLLNPERFAWPGPGSRLELAAQLRRYGRWEEAQAWEQSAIDLGGNHLTRPELTSTNGSLRGRLLLQGEPCSGARVALFRGREEKVLLAKTSELLKSEQTLLQQSWSPVYYQYPDFERLLSFYAVVTTDSQGYFLFENAEPGLYRLGVRLETACRLSNPRELVRLDTDEEMELGTFLLEKP